MKEKPDSSSHALRLRPDFSELCVSLPVLQAHVHKHITALPGVRRISHGIQTLNPAELGLLTYILVNEVPLPCQPFGQLYALGSLILPQEGKKTKVI